MNYSGHRGMVGGRSGYVRARKARARYRRSVAPHRGVLERPCFPTPSVCNRGSTDVNNFRTADTVVARCNQTGGAN
jgi:hypothetical protein